MTRPQTQRPLTQPRESFLADLGTLHRKKEKKELEEEEGEERGRKEIAGKGNLGAGEGTKDRKEKRGIRIRRRNPPPPLLS